MRMILMGTGPFAVPTFQWLLDSVHEVAAIVSRPPHRSTGRRKPTVGPVIEMARRAGTPVWTPHDINACAAQTELGAVRAELMVVCDYGQILAAETLSTTRLGGINLHGSLLPKYRGAAPVNWAIWNGERETGVSVIHMTPRLDAGPVIAVRKTPIGPDEDAVQLEQRLSVLGVEAVREAISVLESWNGCDEIGQRQDPAQATRAPRLKKTDGLVNWQHSAQQIANQVRALKPWPGTFTTWPRNPQPLRLILDRVSVLPDHEVPPTAMAGVVVRADGQQLWIGTGSGCLAIECIQPAGKRVLAVAEFLRGYSIREGDRLGE